MGFARRLVVALGLVAVGCTAPAPAVSTVSMSERPRQNQSGASHGFSYPASPAGSVVDVLHGVAVKDPYRWLEDSSSAETQTWIAAQNRLTRGFLDGLPRRAAIRTRLRELWDFERFELPFSRAGRYFYYYN